MEQSNPFAVALAAHPMPRLRAAFDTCRKADDQGYNRTTLNRWMEGSLPTRGEFVRRLAEELEDASLVEAWERARGRRSDSAARSVVTRFETLPPDERDRAFRQIREHYVSADRPTRSQLVYRIEINDPPDPDADHLVALVSISWSGRLPADAKVVFATSPRELGDAYDDEPCIFREMLAAFTPERLSELLDAGDDQILAYNPVDRDDPSPVTHVGRRGDDNTFHFGNEEIERAHIRLSLSYPVPLATPVFLLRFGQYAVPGPAEVTLTLNSRRADWPRAMQYLPPGQQREWAANQMRRNELFVTLGRAGSVLGEGDGVVFFWTEE